MEGRVELYEVFKVGGAQKEELNNLPLEKLRSQYILMQSLTSKEQLASATELAQLPPPEHMIVDKSKFQQIVNDKVSKAVDLNMRKVRAQADERIFHAHEVFDKDRLAIAHLLKTNIDMERTKLQSIVTNATEKRKKGETVEADELLSKITAVLEEHQRVFDVLFSNPFFSEKSAFDEEEGKEKEDSGEKEEEKKD